MAMVKSGADRQVVHERLRELAMQARDAGQPDEAVAFTQLVNTDAMMLEYLEVAQLSELLDVRGYVGDAPIRALEFVKFVREQFEKS